jgi:putative transcriptional regulator
LNQNLIARRAKLNLTQQEVADRARITRSFYTRIECGSRSPSIAVAKRIADALKTTVDKLFFDHPVPKRNEGA